MNHNEQLEALREKIAADEQASIGGWRQRHRDVSSTVAQLFDVFHDAGGQTRQIARMAAGKMQVLRNDDTMYPEGRDRLIRETREQVTQQIKDLRQKQEGALAALRAHLLNASLPRVTADREMPARDEARMILDAAADPEIVMMDLAQRHDELAAVVTGTWGESYLRARGVRDAPKVIETVRLQATAANVQSPDAQVSHAAQAYLELRDLEMGRDRQQFLVNGYLDRASEGEDVGETVV